MKHGGKVDDNFQVALCEKCGLEVKKKGGCGASQKPNTKQYDNYFQLAFQDGEVRDLQKETFKLHEQGKLKGQKLSKSQGKGSSKEDSPKSILEDMKITPWRQLQGIRERSLMIAILSRVKGGSISLEQMGEEFERQKTMLHMQRIMIEKLNYSNWDKVVQYQLDSSKPHVLEMYMLLFTKMNKDPRVAIKQIPLDFEQFFSWCCLERRKRQQPQSFEITPGLSLYVPDNIDEFPSHWCVHEGRVEEMSTFVTPRVYTPAIADAPYGFCTLNSVNDDVKIKPNIHGYKLDCLSWACEFATIGFYSSLVKFIEQRVTALKELLDEFQEVGMKSMASDTRFFDASGEPQPPIGSEKVGEIVDLVDYEPDNVEVEEQTSDTPLQITSMGEESRNEEKEDLPIQA
ncbi:hypothetical protein L7F22_034341 [Adiantum nelumboides]|nr:hypothetical protein [Adiantum nelumboides]